jgi:hypothetical protein
MLFLIPAWIGANCALWLAGTAIAYGAALSAVERR